MARDTVVLASFSYLVRIINENRVNGLAGATYPHEILKTRTTPLSVRYAKRLPVMALCLDILTLFLGRNEQEKEKRLRRMRVCFCLTMQQPVCATRWLDA